jgi:hypothetical protein
MTGVVATSRKEKTRQRRNNYAWLVALGFENGGDIILKLFVNLWGGVTTLPPR